MRNTYKEGVMKLEERLIVAVDIDPRMCGGMSGAKEKVLNFLIEAQGAGVPVKFNSYLRAYGYDLISIVHDYGLKIFADLKLVDIPKTLELDGVYLQEYKPDMVTVMCSAGITGMHVLQKELPDTKVLGVTVLTSLDEEECQAIFSCSTKAGVLRFARMAQLASLGDLILSSKEVEVLKSRIELKLSFNTPAIRPEWSLVEGDDQSRIMTPYKAILSGADRIVVGRPIMQAPDPMYAIKRTLKEIEQALKDRK